MPACGIPAKGSACCKRRYSGSRRGRNGRPTRSDSPGPNHEQLSDGRCAARVGYSHQGDVSNGGPYHEHMELVIYLPVYSPDNFSHIYGQSLGGRSLTILEVMLGLPRSRSPATSTLLKPVIHRIVRALYLNVSAGHAGGISQPSPHCRERLSRRRLDDSCTSPGQAADALKVGGQVLLPLATARDPHCFLNRRSRELRHNLQNPPIIVPHRHTDCRIDTCH